MNGHLECSSGDAAAYVLGALESYELEPFQRHLATCAVCRDEVAALRTVADMLPSAVPPTAAPRGLRKRVLSTVYDEARLFESASTSRDGSGWTVRLKSSRRPLLRPVTVLGAVAFLAVGMVLGAIGLNGFSSGGPTTRVIQAAVANSSSLTTAEVRLQGKHAELVVAGMAPPPSGQVYEVWVQRGARTDATDALFVPTTNGSADVAVPGNISGVGAVMVTAEPAGGSVHPTSAPVIRASLS
jgi:anti-sigma-K factor RskA